MVSARTFRAREGKSRNRGFARAMRHTPSLSEKEFWYRVRNRQLGGHKFKRQVLIGSYIADFVCIEQKLIVELDGQQHTRSVEYDNARDDFLTRQGFRVVRVWNLAIAEDLDAVLDHILGMLDGSPSP